MQGIFVLSEGDRGAEGSPSKTSLGIWCLEVGNSEGMSFRKQLSGLQLDILRVLWREGEATVARVHDTVSRNRPLAVTTVATVLSRLEKDSIVTHESSGRQFVYRALVSEDEAQRSMVSEFVERLFNGDSLALVSHLVRESDVEDRGIEKVRAKIEEMESRGEE